MLVLHTLLLLLTLVNAAELPVFSGNLDNLSFFDQFSIESLAESGWVVSEAHKEDSTPYRGQWAIDEAYKYPGFAGDRALAMKTDATYYAISKALPQPISAENEDLVVQYEVKYQKEISCAGAYVKLLSDLVKAQEFSDSSPFQVRFGPDICGAENKVDLALRRVVDANPVIGVLSNPPLARRNLLTNLYTLIIRRNRDVEIRINGEVAHAGNLCEPRDFMTPSLEKMPYIEDPSAVKPADWDDREYIIDESTPKPADYDETYGSTWIPNPEIKKPEGWNDDENVPKFIKDPDAVKPAEWNDEEDGEWTRPFIKNPKCIPGCGKWEAPKIINPDYIGEWVAPSIENPNYQGKWTPPLIKNPAQITAEVLSKPINAIGFDLWSMESDTLFNNIYVGHSVSEAERIGNETFVPKRKLEHAVYEKTKPKPKNPPSPPPATFEDLLNAESEGPFSTALEWLVAFAVNQFKLTKAFWERFQDDSLEAIVAQPFRFAVSCFLMLLAFVFSVASLNLVLYLFLAKKLEAQVKTDAALAKRALNDKKLDEVLEKLTGTTTGRESASAVTKTRKTH